MNIKIFLFKTFYISPCSFLNTRAIRLPRRDVTTPVTKPNAEELEVAALLSLVLIVVAKVKELCDFFNLHLQRCFVRSNSSVHSWGASDLKHKYLFPALPCPQE